MSYWESHAEDLLRIKIRSRDVISDVVFARELSITLDINCETADAGIFLKERWRKGTFGPDYKRTVVFNDALLGPIYAYRPLNVVERTVVGAVRRVKRLIGK